MQIVIGAPGRQGRSHMSKRWEERLVEQFVPQPAVEALDEGILDRLARGNVVPVDPHPVSEAQDGIGRELGP